MNVSGRAESINTGIAVGQQERASTGAALQGSPVAARGAGAAPADADDVPAPGLFAATVLDAFEGTCAWRGDQVAIRTKGDQDSITWSQWRDRSRLIAGGLHQLGLRRGGSVALLLSNRPEFHLCDIAAITLGATPFSIYQTYAPNQIQFVVSDAQAQIAIVESQYLPALLSARARLPDLQHVILLDPQQGEALPDGVLSLAEVESLGGQEQAVTAVQSAAALVGPDDVLTLIYTSGTTGPPKGVQLTHRNMMAAVAGVERIVRFPPGSKVISWLPAAHVAERTAHHYVPIACGLQVTTCPDAREVLSYLPEVRPQWFFAVPRIWEKLKAGLEAMLMGLPQERRRSAEQALAAATQRVRLRQRGEPVPPELDQQVAKADDELFAGLRAMLGFDQIVAVNVGAAPTPIEVLEFFHAIGIPLAELWGMSETCGAGCVNPVQRIKLGTVGPPAPGVEIEIAPDGEVLLRGEMVMVGYRNSPERTQEAIDRQGWLHTGDVGVMDEDGYLKIVDRKKEIIINAAGKNMSPAYIEATVKSASPLIGQVCVIGDARRYVTALIVLDADFAPAWAAGNGLGGISLERLATEPATLAAVQEGIDAANGKLARVEQIKRFHIVAGDWLPGGEELTPTMKLKRRPIAQKYSEQIEAMYG